MNSVQEKIVELKKKSNAVILAHTYQPPEIQDIADYVGDSYGLSVQASRASADTIVFCGVRFMAETASILNPSRRVILPEADAGCPMADMIEADDLIKLKEQYPDYLVMCYVNSTAEIKALSDVCCTSSNALKIARKLPVDKGIIFVPDRNLGSYVQEQTGREMVLWDGFCPTHMRIEPSMIIQAKKDFPASMVLIHPEASPECRILADKVFSTGEMCEFVSKSEHQEFIIATEEGIMHTVGQANPQKLFHLLSSELRCPNMKKITLQSVCNALDGSGGEVIHVQEDIAAKALSSLEKMLQMSK